MPESALIEAVNQLSGSVERTEEELTALRADIANLPDNYIPREEAKEKAEAVKSILGLTVTALLVAGLIVLGIVLYVKDSMRENCRGSRMSLRAVIERAVPDTAQPLKSDLLSMEGTQPSKCR